MTKKPTQKEKETLVNLLDEFEMKLLQDPAFAKYVNVFERSDEPDYEPVQTSNLLHYINDVKMNIK